MSERSRIASNEENSCFPVNMRTLVWYSMPVFGIIHWWAMSAPEKDFLKFKGLLRHVGSVLETDMSV